MGHAFGASESGNGAEDEDGLMIGIPIGIREGKATRQRRKPALK